MRKTLSYQWLSPERIARHAAFLYISDYTPGWLGQLLSANELMVGEINEHEKVENPK